MGSMYSGKRIESLDRRTGLPDRRNDDSSEVISEDERRAGPPDRRVATEDRHVRVITGNGEFKGSINLNSASENVDRVVDFFTKTEIAFLRMYNTIVMGQPGKVRFINVEDLAVIIPEESIELDDDLRRDVDVMVKLKNGLGQIKGKTNLMGENQSVDRISDLLNISGKKWLTVYDASYKGNQINSAIINLSFISSVEDCS